MTANSPPRVLLTAFEDFAEANGVVRENASRLAVERVAANPPEGVLLSTQIYAVDFATIRNDVERDAGRGYDAIVMTGQAGTSARLRLELRARNFGVDWGENAGFPLAADGDAALESTLFTPQLIAALFEQGLNAQISDDAGNYLCNAAYYYALLAFKRREKSQNSGRPTRVGFIHLPLAPAFAMAGEPSMPTEEAARLLKAVVLAAVKTNL